MKKKNVCKISQRLKLAESTTDDGFETGEESSVSAGINAFIANLELTNNTQKAFWGNYAKDSFRVQKLT